VHGAIGYHLAVLQILEDFNLVNILQDVGDLFIKSKALLLDISEALQKVAQIFINEILAL
jgi:hypothetical protein